MRPASIVLAVALPLAVVDLIWKAVATTPAWAYHTRSLGWLTLSVALVAGSFVAARAPVAAAPLAAGVMAGGVLGNVLSAVGNGLQVPNPIIATSGSGVIAFNLADVFTSTGILALTGALAVALIRHRHLLPSRQDARAMWARALQRRI